MNDDRHTVRVALVATHPIQYQVPWFQRLAAEAELDLKVFFGLMPDAAQQGVGFGVNFQWDIPLLDGYRWELLRNTAAQPSLGAFRGCRTPDIYRELRIWRPDVIVLTGWQSLMLLQAWWASVRLRVPRIIRGESSNLTPMAPWKRLGHRMWLRTFDRILAIGEANRAFYQDAGVPAEHILDSPYFIDNDRFTTAAAQLRGRREELRRDWGIASDARCFLFAGKLIPKKRPLDLLQALRAARDAAAPVHLLVVGTGELLEQARDLAKGNSLPVTFTGFLNQTEIAQAYTAADCLVIPSDAGETWGLVVNEAMACGIPAIVSDQVGCGPDLVIEGETGAVFPMGNVNALADTLVRLASDPVRLRAMGDRARRRVLAEYSVERAVDGTLAAIRAAVRRQ